MTGGGHHSQAVISLHDAFGDSFHGQHCQEVSRPGFHTSPPLTVASSENTHSTTWSNAYHARQASLASCSTGSFPKRQQIQDEGQFSLKLRQGHSARQGWISCASPEGHQRTAAVRMDTGEVSKQRDTRCSSSLLRNGATMNNEGVRRLPVIGAIRSSEPSYRGRPIPSLHSGEWASYASSCQYSQNAHEMPNVGKDDRFFAPATLSSDPKSMLSSQSSPASTPSLGLM